MCAFWNNDFRPKKCSFVLWKKLFPEKRCMSTSEDTTWFHWDQASMQLDRTRGTKTDTLVESYEPEKLCQFRADSFPRSAQKRTHLRISLWRTWSSLLYSSIPLPLLKRDLGLEIKVSAKVQSSLALHVPPFSSAVRTSSSSRKLLLKVLWLEYPLISVFIAAVLKHKCRIVSCASVCLSPIQEARSLKKSFRLSHNLIAPLSQFMTCYVSEKQFRFSTSACTLFMRRVQSTEWKLNADKYTSLYHECNIFKHEI